MRKHRVFAFGSLRAAVAAGVLLFNAAPAIAQNYDQVAPKMPARSRAGGSLGDVPPPPAATKDNRRILPALKGLRFVSRAQNVIRNGVSTPGIDTTAVSTLDDAHLKTRLRAYLGRPLTLGDLNTITRTIVLFLRAHGRPLSDVTVPEQDVSSGVIQIVVTQYRLGLVKTSSTRWFSPAIIRDGVTVESGKFIDLHRLQHDLAWLNRNPFRTVNAVFEPGRTIGTTDILLQVKERFPFRAYAGYDNSGTAATGENRWSAGFNFGDLFGLDHQLSYQFQTGDDFPRHVLKGNVHFMAHSLTYLAPLPWQDLVEVFGDYVRQSPNLGPFFGQIGHSAQISARYVHPFFGPDWLTQELQFGFDYKTTDNNLAFGGVRVFSASQDVDQFVLTYDASATDSWGVTDLQNDLTLSPGGLTIDNTDAAFAQSGVAQAKARYLYDTLSITRATRLPYDFSWLMRMRGQWSNGNLLLSEQLPGGGENSVRGYETRTASGSQGVNISEELRSPPFGLLSLFLGKYVHDSVQPLVFWDYAWLTNPHAQPAQPKTVTLESAGAGVNYAMGEAVNVRFDYGWQLVKLPGAAARGSRAGISVTLAY